MNSHTLFLDIEKQISPCYATFWPRAVRSQLGDTATSYSSSSASAAPFCAPGHSDTRRVGLPEVLSGYYHTARIPREIASALIQESTFDEEDSPLGAKRRSDTIAAFFQISHVWDRQDADAMKGDSLRSATVKNLMVMAYLSKSSLPDGFPWDDMLAQIMSQQRPETMSQLTTGINTRHSENDIRPEAQSAAPETEWRLANRRRVELIKKRIAKTASSAELTELDALQRKADEYVSQFARPDYSVLEDLERRFGVNG